MQLKTMSVYNKMCTLIFINIHHYQAHISAYKYQIFKIVCNLGILIIWFVNGF